MAVGRRQDAVDGDLRAFGHFRHASSDSQLCRLTDTVVNHVRRREGAHLAGDEDDAAPVLLEHQREVVAGEAHAGHHVELQHAGPVVVGDVGKRLGFVEAEVVHQDVHSRRRRGQRLSPFGRREVGHHGVNDRCGCQVFDSTCGFC